MDKATITKTYTINADGNCHECECEYDIECEIDVRSCWDNDYNHALCLAFGERIDGGQCEECKDYLEVKRRRKSL